MAIFCLSTANAGSITGRASVVDGDTLEIRGERIRLSGVDAPESWQRCKDAKGQEYRCGKIAANALDEWLARSRPTRCMELDRDRYKRMVADCFRADGQSVGSCLVRNGHALDWRRYSKGAYAADQAQARAARRGMWQGTFVEPWDARKRR
ncbi:MAG TPA: thermonuclease family protein [Pseudorhizobium sp.]|jgi:endonuclease YncB( thermonuclease family)|nr:thermonuclease family protein [Pseudorhizobium sp.]